MPQRVVDLLEVIKVDAQQGEAALRPLGLRHHLAETVLEQRPVRQPGEKIVLRQKADFLLRFDLAGDVAADAAVADELAGVVENRTTADLGDAPLPGGIEVGEDEVAEGRRHVEARQAERDFRRAGA